MLYLQSLFLAEMLLLLTNISTTEEASFYSALEFCFGRFHMCVESYKVNSLLPGLSYVTQHPSCSANTISGDKSPLFCEAERIPLCAAATLSVFIPPLMNTLASVNMGAHLLHIQQSHFLFGVLLLGHRRVLCFRLVASTLNTSSEGPFCWCALSSSCATHPNKW